MIMDELYFCAMNPKTKALQSQCFLFLLFFSIQSEDRYGITTRLCIFLISLRNVCPSMLMSAFDNWTA